MDRPDLLGELRRHVLTRGHDVALTWLADLAEPTASRTYRELDDAAAAVAAQLRRRVAGGDRVLLLLPPGLEFVTAFLGCLYAGCVAVPVYPVLDSAAGAAVLARIVADSGAALAWVADAPSAERATAELGIPSAWHTGADRYWPGTATDPQLPAFLQYTSGSTGHPKGVVVTHGSLAANLTAIGAAFAHDASAVVLSWLPAYHDMGLIGNILHPLHMGCRAYLAPPSAFIRNPLAWPAAVARYRATTSGGPNFAYDLVGTAAARRGIPALDLTGWRTAYCGAEPVSASTLERFAQVFAPAGFRAEAFVPCYGLAEATLLVSSGEVRSGVRTRRRDDGSTVVSCGVPRDCQVLVVDPETGRVLPDGHVGEVRVSGAGVAAGYWNQPDRSREVFASTVAGYEGAFLRTGDLGFLADRELYLSGRIKDVIVIRGRNHHPHDLERLAAERVRALRAGRVVAFADPAGDGIVVVGEVAPNARLTDEHHRELSTVIATVTGLALTELIGVPAGTVQRTTSGKLRRTECRQRYLRGDYDRFRTTRPAATRPAQPPGSGRRAASVRAAVAEVLGAPVPDREPLVRLALDSLRALYLSGLLLREAGLDIPVRTLLGGASLADLLAEQPQAERPEAEQPPAERPEAERPEAEQPPAEQPARVPGGSGTRRADGGLSTGQESLAFLQVLDPASDEYTISLAWQLDPAIDVAAFHEALRLAIRRQPELAMRIVTNGGKRREPVPAARLDESLALVPTPVPDDRLTDRLAEAAAAPLPLADGPLLRLYLWQSPQRRVYQLVVHHAVTDLWSLCLVLRDTAGYYPQLRAGRVPVPAAAVSYDEYVTAARAYLASAAAARDGYLRERMPRRGRSLGLRTDFPMPRRRSRRAGRVRREVRVDGVAGQDRVALLTAVWAACLHRYGTPNPVVVGVPVVGRPSGRLAEVGGLCTNTVPLALKIDPEQPLSRLVHDARDQLLLGIDEGLYPLARAVEVVRPERVPGRLPLVETLVTVHQNPLPQATGLLDALAGLESDIHLGELALRTVAVPRHSCRYDLDLTITPREGEYLLTLDYAADVFRPTTAAGLLATYTAMVQAAVAPLAERVRDLFVLSDEDRDLLARLGRCDTAAPDRSLVASVRAHAEQDPGRPAVVEAGRVIGYAEFVARMDQVAAVLSRAADEEPVP